MKRLDTSDSQNTAKRTPVPVSSKLPNKPNVSQSHKKPTAKYESPLKRFASLNEGNVRSTDDEESNLSHSIDQLGSQ